MNRVTTVHTAATAAAAGDDDKALKIAGLPRELTMLSQFTERDLNDLLRKFGASNDREQVELVKRLVDMVNRRQQRKIRRFIDYRLQRDVMRDLLEYGYDFLASKILGYLDPASLLSAQHVSRIWRNSIDWQSLWADSFWRRVASDDDFRTLVHDKNRGFMQQLIVDEEQSLCSPSYRTVFGEVLRRLQRIDKNWRESNCVISRLECRSEHSKGVYCLQYDEDKIVCGLRDRSMKVFRRELGENGVQSAVDDFSLTGHTGSVLCLQYYKDIVVSGSSDATIRIWSLSERKHLRTIVHHSEAVLHLRFDGKRLVSSSKDRTLAVFEVVSAPDYVTAEPNVLHGHRAAVNVVDFDANFIVSASGDRTIRVWDAQSLDLKRTLTGHKRGIACLQYKDGFVISGSSDNTIRIWDVFGGECLRILEGHEELVRCVRFDNYRIISGAYDGVLKIWDLEKALSVSPRYNDADCCIFTERVHAGRIFRLQFDFRIIMSSAHDDTISFIDFDQ